ncbi:MAG: hypothetical protein ACXWC4_14935 [Telluria sp.]
MTYPEATLISVSKIDAARRQLQTAIDLWISDCDPVSVHTLAYAAHQIVHDLNRANKGPHLLLDAPFVREEMRREVIEVIKRDANFFKHADNRGGRRPEPRSIDFSPDVNELFFGITITGLQYMGLPLTCRENSMMLWLGINRPDLFVDGWSGVLRTHFPDSSVEILRKMGKPEFFEKCERVLQRDSR